MSSTPSALLNLGAPPPQLTPDESDIYNSEAAEMRGSCRAQLLPGSVGTSCAPAAPSLAPVSEIIEFSPIFPL